jgi:two-component system LytT family response regulator
MPRLNGFDVLARLPSQPIVVFTTAHDQYALQAFAVNSVDYLLKPVDPSQLDRALGRVERLRSRVDPSPPDVQGLLTSLAEALRKNSRPEYPERIASRLGDRLWFIDLAQVTHFFARDKLTYAVEAGKPYCVDYTIVQLEKMLNPRRFLRIHRSTIVNTAWIKEVTTLPGGSLNVRLKDTTSTDLTVSRDRVREFKARLLAN